MKKNIVFAFLLICSLTFSQNKEFEDVILDDLINETQFSNDSTDDIEIIWWLPTEYWQVVFAQDELASPSEAEMIVELVQDYTVIIVIKGKVGLFGGVSFSPRNDIEGFLSAKYNETELSLVDEDNLEPDFINFISMIKPIMKNIMGPMGENMQVFVFENRHKDIIDARTNGMLKIALGEFVTELNLPLSSLILEKRCPKENKLYNGKWSFCPYCGTELKSQ